MSAHIDDDTVEIPKPRGAEVDRPPLFSALVQADVAGLSHQGYVRPNNEDHFLTCRFGRFLHTLQTNLEDPATASRFEETGYGLVVADGMGGTAAGELASSRAIQTMINLVLNTPDWILLLQDEPFSNEVARRATERYREVNDTLSQQAEAEPLLRGFGTTMIVATSLGTDLFLTHIGDSRAYIFRRGQLVRLTHDHTVAQLMADAGEISQQEVATHRLRHVLTGFLGDNAREVRPDVRKLRLEDGDLLLLCTDGLTDMVPDQELTTQLASVAARNSSSEETCQLLIQQALDAGGRDNITVVVARYRFPTPAEQTL